MASDGIIPSLPSGRGLMAQVYLIPADALGAYSGAMIGDALGKVVGYLNMPAVTMAVEQGATHWSQHLFRSLWGA